jgi:peptidoglycan hydrolase-like protein with peptidoglycan-binding domain
MLPELLKVDCWFGEDTENATKLFQEWTGNLKVDGKIGPSTWKELISFSDAFPLIYNKPYPEPNFPPENSDIMTIAGLGVIDNSPVMIASADPVLYPILKMQALPGVQNYIVRQRILRSLYSWLMMRKRCSYLRA